MTNNIFYIVISFLGGGKHHFPNQATWPQSRFYKEFNTAHLKLPASPASPASPSVTTLFTLRPLDSTATSISEMKVMYIVRIHEQTNRILLI